MKDLTEAQLIEMERRAISLLNDADEDPDEMSRNELTTAWEGLRGKAEQISLDVQTLCAQLRSKETA
jgi:hypothetical protein